MTQFSEAFGGSLYTMTVYDDFTVSFVQDKTLISYGNYLPETKHVAFEQDTASFQEVRDNLLDRVEPWCRELYLD